MTAGEMEDWIGRLIGNRYQLESLIASGGMGDVFLATDLRLGKRVALKVLKNDLIGTETFLERFEQEVKVCTHLESPHIVQISDYGAEDEMPYYVMEYLQGETLGQRLKREKPLPVIEALQIMLQICQGMQTAHEGVVLSNSGHVQKRKIIHRDLKPDNFFLVPLGAGVLVKILDFGIAKVCHDQLAEQTRNLTGTNFFLGTPRYASPEQIDHQERIDERADIYSLGFILYEMLSGVDPFGYDHDQKPHSWVSWAMAHTSKNIVPLRSQAGCQHLPSSLEAVVNRCLQKAPSDRFASVKELVQTLKEALNRLDASPPSRRSGTVPSAPPPSPLRNLGSVPQAQPAAQPTSLTPAQPKVEAPPPHALAPLSLPASHLQTLNQMMREALGPIAPLLLQQTLTQTRNLNDLPDQLSMHLPPEQQAEFKMRVQTLLTNPVPRETLVKPAVVPKPISDTQLQAVSVPQGAQSLTAEFISQCRTELALRMGPMANFLVQQTLSQSPNLTPAEFVRRLAMNLGNPEAERAFCQKLLAQT